MAHPRPVSFKLVQLSKGFPALGLLGPRQIGKSTLARLAFPSWTFFDLENTRDSDRLRADPLFVLEQHQRLVIDEALRMPELC